MVEGAAAWHTRLQSRIRRWRAIRDSSPSSGAAALRKLLVGGGPAGLSAALTLGRARRCVLLCDAGQGRNATVKEAHGFLTRDGSLPGAAPVARQQLEISHRHEPTWPTKGGIHKEATSSRCCGGRTDRWAGTARLGSDAARVWHGGVGDARHGRPG